MTVKMPIEIGSVAFETADNDLVSPTPGEAPDDASSDAAIFRQVKMAQVLASIRTELAQVEAKMKTVDSSLFAPLASAFVDLIGSGGKRIRPALALMTAKIGTGTADVPRPDAVVALAASVEMLHTATLVHDDVIDGALLRRGAPTLNASWNRGATVLAGNFMFARAARFAAETGDIRVVRIFSNTLQAIVDGELRQLAARHEFRQDKKEYYDRIYAKTASLFCGATEAAAILAGLPADRVQHLRDYGYNLGMAFQIVDDILDFTGDERSLGKPAGSDLRQGTLTLPFFHFLQQERHRERMLDRLEASFAATGYDTATNGRCSDSSKNGNGQHEDNSCDDENWNRVVDDLVHALRDSSAIEAARADAVTFLDKARASLAVFPNSPYKRSMLDLCDFVVQRTF